MGTVYGTDRGGRSCLSVDRLTIGLMDTSNSTPAPEPSDPVARVWANNPDRSHEVPPGPWTWRRVVPEAPAPPPSEHPADTEPQGQALIADDGTWVVSSEDGYGSPDVHPAARELLAKAWTLEQVPELLRLFGDFREATTPVAQADALLQFSNALYHFAVDLTGDTEPFTDRTREGPAKDDEERSRLPFDPD